LIDTSALGGKVTCSSEMGFDAEQCPQAVFRRSAAL